MDMNRGTSKKETDYPKKYTKKCLIGFNQKSENEAFPLRLRGKEPD